MNLKILLPSRIFREQSAVMRIVAETTEGSIGLLPHRLDCAAVLVPGILTYEADAALTYVAVDSGVLVKAGQDVLVAVHRALGGSSLADLQAAASRTFAKIDDRERQVRAAVAKMEAGLMGRLVRLQREQ